MAMLAETTGEFLIELGLEAGKDYTVKKTVGIRYPVGFESR